MKKLIAIVLTISLCALLPSCFKKDASKKTTKVIEKEIETRNLTVENNRHKEPVEIEEADFFEDEETE